MSNLSKILPRYSAEKSELLSLLLREKGIERKDKVRRRSRQGRTPLSFAQQRIWFLQQLEPDNPQYNIPVGVRLKGALDVGALAATLREIVRRHEVLRTVFPVVEGEPAQVVMPAPELELPLLDLGGFGEAERRERAQRFMDEESQRTFDLAEGPLVRFFLLRLAEDEHWLLVFSHHMVLDTWSVGIFGRELAAIYSAFAAGEPSPLPELSIQYGDFAAWQREWFRGEVLEEQLGYWTKKLAGAPPLLTLPTDRPRPAVQRFRGRVEPFTFPRDLAAALNELSRGEGATLFMTMMAAFQTLLHRYTGQADIVAGTASGSRSRSETEDLIGCFMNTLLIRADFKGDPTFRELLRQVQQATLEAFAHHDLPFEKLVSALHPKRDMSYSPLTQVMLILHNTQLSGASPAGLEMTRLSMPEKTTAQYDLLIHVRETDAGLRGMLEYNTDLFNPERARQMVGHFRTLLEEVVRDPDRRVSELNVMSEEERRRLLVELNDTRREFTPQKTFTQLFEEQAARQPEAVALTCGPQRLSYRELNARANRLAHYLRERGVGPEVRVAVCLERGVEMVVALLGVLKAGGAYVPVDPTYPPERLEYMLRDAGAPVLLTQKLYAPYLVDGQHRLISLDSDWQFIAARADDNPEPLADDDNLAYVLYTSGSTGRPKGVMVKRGALDNFLRSMAEKLELGSGDTLAAVTTLSFDIAGLELYLPLMVGAGVALASREETMDGRLLRALVEGQGVTAMQATPVTWRMLLEAGWQGGPDFKVFCGGELLPAELARQLVATGAKVWNLYGPTETTIWSTVKRLGPDAAVTIGRPIGNTTLYVLDSSLRPVPAGVPGELYIGGRGVARGYLHRPDLTAERFIPDPFSAEPGARLYRTGDLVRYLPDGEVEYLERIDNQVKIRGLRIELGEIEAALSQHPAVGQAVVVAREDVPGEKHLVAYVVPGGAEAGEGGKPRLQVHELREFLRRKLPFYMIPSSFVTLAEMPLTPNGKIDRKALPAPGASRPDTGTSYVAPRTPTEEAMANIWSEVLQVKQVGAEDNFFELGGDSLLIQRLLAKIQDAFQVTVPIRNAFFNPTVAHLAAVVERARKSDAGEEEHIRGVVDSLSDEQIDLLLGETLKLVELEQQR